MSGHEVFIKSFGSFFAPSTFCSPPFLSLELHVPSLPIEEPNQKYVSAQFQQRQKYETIAAKSSGVTDSFDQLGLNQEILQGIRDMGYSKPTNIQSQAVPPALQGRDV